MHRLGDWFSHKLKFEPRIFFRNDSTDSHQVSMVAILADISSKFENSVVISSSLAKVISRGICVISNSESLRNFNSFSDLDRFSLIASTYERSVFSCSLRRTNLAKCNLAFAEIRDIRSEPFREEYSSFSALLALRRDRL